MVECVKNLYLSVKNANINPQCKLERLILWMCHIN